MRSFLRSTASGSFTFTIMSARGEDVVGLGRDLGAGGLVVVVGETGAHAGVGLDQDLMALGGQLAHRRGHEPDAEFVVLDLLGHADEHLISFLVQGQHSRG